MDGCHKWLFGPRGPGIVGGRADVGLMQQVADMTGGKYFRATDNKKLKEIYTEIDRMEKTIFEEKNFTNKAERFLPFAITAAVLLLLEFILKKTYFRSIL